MLVGSRILEIDQQSAVHFSQDLNHFSVGVKIVIAHQTTLNASPT
jgi:hypothetical protein